MQSDNNSKNDKQVNAYLKYSAIGFQMIGVIGFSVWAGIKLDEYMKLSFPWFTVILSVLGFAGSMISVIKSLPKNN